jgi:hypothetical protein
MYPLEKAAETYARMMSGNAEFRVVLKIWTSAHTTLTAVIVRIGNEKSASVYQSPFRFRCLETM